MTKNRSEILLFSMIGLGAFSLHSKSYVIAEPVFVRTLVSPTKLSNARSVTRPEAMGKMTAVGSINMAASTLSPAIVPESDDTINGWDVTADASPYWIPTLSHGTPSMEVTEVMITRENRPMTIVDIPMQN